MNTKFTNIEVRADSITVVWKLACLSSYRRGRLTSQPLKTKIRNFSEKVSSLYRIPEVTTTEIFRKLCFFIHSASSGWNFEPALSAPGVSFHATSPRNTATQRANFAPFLSNQVISNFPLFFSYLFSFFSRFYLIIDAFFLPKIWNYRQRSFLLPFKLRNFYIYRWIYVM